MADASVNPTPLPVAVTAPQPTVNTETVLTPQPVTVAATPSDTALTATVLHLSTPVTVVFSFPQTDGGVSVDATPGPTQLSVAVPNGAATGGATRTPLLTVGVSFPQGYPIGGAAVAIAEPSPLTINVESSVADARQQGRLPRIPFTIPARLETPPLNDLSATVVGAATVSNTAFDVDLADWPVPLQIGFGGAGVNDLYGTTMGATVISNTSPVQINSLAATPSGRTVSFDVIEATGEDPRKLTATDKASITASASSGINLAYALDGVVDGNHYYSQRSQNNLDWVKFDFGSGIVLTQVAQVCNHPTDYTRGFNVDGSVDNTTWTTLASGYGAPNSTITTPIPEAKQAPYRYYRIIITSGAGNHWRVNEFDFWAMFDRGFVNLELMDGTVSPAGQTVVSAFLQNGLLDGGGAFIVELASVSSGSTTVDSSEWLHLLFEASFLYLHSAVTAGFEPTDTYSGSAVSQTFPDGNTRNSFPRFLHEYTVVGVGFEDSDDVSGEAGFVSQSYPDGNIRDDWARYLYEWVVPISSGPDAHGQLIVRPGWSPKANPAIPPSGKHV